MCRIATISFYQFTSTLKGMFKSVYITYYPKVKACLEIGSLTILKGLKQTCACDCMCSHIHTHTERHTYL